MNEIQMPDGRAVVLAETVEEHLARCRHCSRRQRSIEWDLTVAATDRRAVRVSLENIRQLVGDPGATGNLVVSGLRPRPERWRALAPASISDAPDFTFSQRSLHDRAALTSALTAASAPPWWDTPTGAFRLRNREGSKEPTEMLVLGPPEEYFGWLGCAYCETYRSGRLAVAPRITALRARAGTRTIIRLAAADIASLLMKKDADAALGPESAQAALVHDLRDALHALGIDDPKPGSARLTHWSARNGAHTYIYPIHTALPDPDDESAPIPPRERGGASAPLAYNG